MDKNIVLCACTVSFPSSSFELLLLWMFTIFAAVKAKGMVIIKHTKRNSCNNSKPRARRKLMSSWSSEPQVRGLKPLRLVVLLLLTAFDA